MTKSVSALLSQENNVKTHMDEEKTESRDIEGEETRRLMKDHEVDQDTAEKAQELIDEGLDEDEAVEIAEEL